MGGREAERIETIVDRVAAALFAAAVAYAFFKLANASYPQPQLGAFTASAAAIAFLLCGGVLRRVEPEGRRFAVPEFALPAVEAEADELVLTEFDRLRVVRPEPEDELLLTDANRLQPAELDELLLTEFAEL